MGNLETVRRPLSSLIYAFFLKKVGTLNDGLSGAIENSTSMGSSDKLQFLSCNIDDQLNTKASQKTQPSLRGALFPLYETRNTNRRSNLGAVQLLYNCQNFYNIECYPAVPQASTALSAMPSAILSAAEMPVEVSKGIVSFAVKISQNIG